MLRTRALPQHRARACEGSAANLHSNGVQRIMLLGGVKVVAEYCKSMGVASGGQVLVLAVGQSLRSIANRCA
jgi:methylmalonyl-CoA mutase cobalamin-binding subunit